MLDLELYWEQTKENLKLILGGVKGEESFKKHILNLDIKGKKVILFIGGSQIKGSISPLMHNYMAYKHGLNIVYLLCIQNTNLQYDELISIYERAHTLYDEVLGLNITMPFKEEFYKMFINLHKLDENASNVGAINIIGRIANQPDKGVFCGYNTDVEGITSPLNNYIFPDKVENAILLGAGGAARAIFYALIKMNIKNIRILNRNQSQTNNLIKDFAYKQLLNNIDYKSVFYDVTINGNLIHDLISPNTIIINSLPFGFKDDFPKFPILTDQFDKIADKIKIYYDIVYNANNINTPLLDYIHNKYPSIKTFNGRDMVIHQAKRGFEIWTNKEFDIKAIYKLF